MLAVTDPCQLSWTLITRPCLNPNTLSLSMPLLGLMAYVSLFFCPSFRTATPFFHISFRKPDATVHSQASPLVSLEVRHLLFPFISPCRLNITTPSPALSHHRQ